MNLRYPVEVMQPKPTDLGTDQAVELPRKISLYISPCSVAPLAFALVVFCVVFVPPLLFCVH